MYRLDKDKISFPHPQYANDDGLLAYGGDLSLQRLLLAYEYGIFPWYNPEDPILWWSPDPRMVLFPEEVKISKSMRQVLRKNTFEIRYDTAFSEVLEHCAQIPRKGMQGTWLSEEMQNAYNQLHQQGFAHSVEAWSEGKLVGGLYGISLGKCFYGESMFSHQSNASKACLIHLAQALEKRDFQVIDCQVHSPHLQSMGAREIPREEFMEILQQAVYQPTIRRSWTEEFRLG